MRFSIASNFVGVVRVPRHWNAIEDGGPLHTPCWGLASDDQLLHLDARMRVTQEVS